MIRFAILFLAAAAMVLVTSAEAQAQCSSGYSYGHRGHSYGNYGGHQVYRPSSGININYNSYRPSVYRSHNYYPSRNVHYGGHYGGHRSYGHAGHNHYGGYRNHGGHYGGRGGVSIGFRF